MSDAYNKMIALIRSQMRTTGQGGALYAVIAKANPIRLEIMGQEITGVILAQGINIEEEDEGQRLLCVPTDVGLVAVACF